MLKTMTNEWKERVRPILQLFVDRLPGALLEEKEFSLAWHYRRADPEQASLRAKELLDDLTGYTRNIDVQVFEGNKVIELRNSGINKGTAALEWLLARRRNSSWASAMTGRTRICSAPCRRTPFPCALAWPTPPRVFILATTPPCGGCCGKCPPRPAARHRNHEAGAPISCPMSVLLQELKRADDQRQRRRLWTIFNSMNPPWTAPTGSSRTIFGTR
jgi:hypothetical protein